MLWEHEIELDALDADHPGMACCGCGTEDTINRSWCRPCKQAYDRGYHDRTRERRNELKRASQSTLRAARRAHVREYLRTHPCVDCGETDIVVLEFDHLDPTTKTASVSRAMNANWTIAKIEAEMAKCVVRCANCHRRRTAKQFGYGY